MEVRSGSSIGAVYKEASINLPKASAWRSTRKRRRKDRARATSDRNRDLQPLTPLRPTTIVLFDIDGTLIFTGGAGSRAMNRAFEDEFEVARAFDGIPMAGRTDRKILDDAAARVGVQLSPSDLRRFWQRYRQCLSEALTEPHSLKRELPGVRVLLRALAARRDVFSALLTGNGEAGAQLKLQYFDLWQFFRCGAFGDEVADRNALFAVAMERARGCGVDAAARDVLVVGDTELDVACAAAAGARAIAVATGTASVDQLQRTGAEVVFGDLSDTAAFLNLL